MNPNVVVLVDFAQYFHKWCHYLAAKRGDAPFLETEQDEKQLVEGVMRSLIADIGRYKYNLDRVYLVADSIKSWRKMIPVNNGEVFYKATRNKKEYTFDYKKMMGLVDEMLKVLEKRGAYVLLCDECEADDLIAHISTRLFKDGISSIIISSDSDLKQLIASSNETFIYVYDPDLHKKKHYIDKFVTSDGSDMPTFRQEFNPASESEALDDLLGLSADVNDNDSRDKFTKLLNSIYDVSTIINPYEIAFCKMLSGDKGDNVPSVYLKPVKNGYHSFTELRAQSIFSKIGDTVNPALFKTLWESEEARRDMATRVLGEVSSTELNKIGLVADNIKRNIQYTYLLDSMVYPEGVMTRIQDYVTDLFQDIPRLKAHKEAISGGFYWEMLEGSRFETRDSNSVDFDTRNGQRY